MEGRLVDQETLLEWNSELKESLNEDHVILYVGQKAVREGLPAAVRTCPWDAIVTSSTKRKQIEDAFHVGDTVEASATDALARMRLDKNIKPVVFLFPASLPEDAREQSKARTKAARAMERIFAKMDMSCRLLIIGYEGDGEEADAPELDSTVFSTCLEERQKRVTVFGGSAPLSAELACVREEWESYGVAWRDCTLAEILAANDEDEEDAEDAEELSAFAALQAQPRRREHLYVSGQRISIPATNHRWRNETVEILTEELLNRDLPSGERARQRKFQRFLEASASAPQWYGYSPKTEFYIERAFERPLCTLVRDLLDGKNPADEDAYGMPVVVLHGAPCSSKSVELGALAYRIFEERRSPVIYIREKNSSFRRESDEWKQLETLLDAAGHLGDGQPRTLVLWDSSSHADAAMLARRLHKSLVDQGRRFVLVCTSYEHDFRSERPADDRRPSDRCFRFAAGAKGERYGTSQETDAPPWDAGVALVYHNQRFYLRATRTMTTGEETEMDYRLVKYATRSKTQTDLKRRLALLGAAQQHDLFARFYQVIAVLRPQLENGLTIEQKIADRYVQEQCERIAREAGGYQDDENPFAVLWQLPFLQPGEEDSAEPAEDAVSDFRGRLQAFSTCIAIFSQFGQSVVQPDRARQQELAAPFALAARMLSEGRRTPGRSTEEDTQRLLIAIRALTYIQNDVEHGTFRFRMPFEATHYLRSNGITADDQCDLIEQMLDDYAVRVEEGGVSEPQTCDALARLLRKIGPNSDEEDALPDVQKLRRVFLLRMNRVIAQLDRVRETRFADPDHLLLDLEITFLREYYGARGKHEEPIWGKPESWTCAACLDRLEHLAKADTLIGDRLTMLDREEEQHRLMHGPRWIDWGLRWKRHHLINERAHCNIRINQLKKEIEKPLKAAAPDEARAVRAKVEEIPELRYNEIYGMLAGILAEEPYNTYYYTALFHAFLNENENLLVSKEEDKRKKNLVDILQIVEDVKSLGLLDDTDGSAKIELSNLIVRIGKLRELQVTLSAFEAGACPDFQETFDWMLDEENPAALCALFREELYANGIERPDAWNFDDAQDDKRLTADQVDVCDHILQFLERGERHERYQNCMQQNLSALMLLLRVTWMRYDGWRWNWKKEWQKTYMDDVGWQKLQSLAERCHDLAQQEQRQRNDVVELLRVLSAAQLRDYTGASDILDALQDWHTMWHGWRMHVPYILCDADGTPRRFTGHVKRPDDAPPYMVVQEPESGTTAAVQAHFSERTIWEKEEERGRTRVEGLALGPRFAGSWETGLYTKMAWKWGRLR